MMQWMREKVKPLPRRMVDEGVRKIELTCECLHRINVGAIETGWERGELK
jgi:hypothetical protein